MSERGQRVTRGSKYRPILITILCAILLAIGSCFGAFNFARGPLWLLGRLFAWCLGLCLFTIAGAILWAVVTWIERLRGNKED